MQVPVLYERINEKGFEGQYYAHIPTLGLLTQGIGIDGAKAAAIDLVRLWIDDQADSDKLIKQKSEVFFSSLEV
jgi:predicted RNase H-like HicB family nuclease